MSERQLFDDVSKYDVYLGIAGHREVTVEALREHMWLTSECPLQEHIDTLVAEKLVVKKDSKYSAAENAHSKTLFELLSYALAMDIDYNFYLETEVVQILHHVYGRLAFSLGQLKMKHAPHTYRLIRHLCLDNMCIIFTYAPLTAKLVRNRFFDLLCEYVGIRPHKVRFYDRKVDISAVILRLFFDRAQRNRSQIASASNLYFSHGEPYANPPVPKLQVLLKHDIIPLNPEVFDTTASDRQLLAERYMNQLLNEKRNISLDIIRTYHAILTHGEHRVDDYRNFDVYIRDNANLKPASHEDIPEMMRRMITLYKNESHRINNVPDALALGATLYNEIIHIQPFDDGNSRTARIALLHVLKLFNTGIDKLPRSYDIRLLILAKGQPKRDDTLISEALKELTLNIINKQDLKEMSQYA